MNVSRRARRFVGALVPLVLLGTVHACGGGSETEPDGPGVGGLAGGPSAVGGSGGSGLSSGGGGGLGGEGGAVPVGTGAAASFGNWHVLTALDSERFVLGYASMRELSLSLYDLEGTLERRTADSFQLEHNLDLNEPALFSVALDPSDGGYWLTGHTRRPLKGLEQTADFDTFLVKFDEKGQRLWAQQYFLAEVAPPASIYEMSVESVDADGNAYTLKQYLHVATFGKLDPQGDTVWEREVAFDSIFYEHFPDYSGVYPPVDGELHFTNAAKAGSGYLWASLASLNGGGLSVSYLWMVIKIEEGTVVWSKAFMEPCEGSAVDGDWISALGVTRDESAIYAVGPCLTKLDGDGTLVWSTKGPDDYQPILGGLDFKDRFSLLPSEADDAFYVVTPNGTSFATASSKLVRYDSKGKLVWRIDDVGGRIEDFHVLPDSGELLYTLHETGGKKKIARRGPASGAELSRLP